MTVASNTAYLEQKRARTYFAANRKKRTHVLLCGHSEKFMYVNFRKEKKIQCPIRYRE